MKTKESHSELLGLTQQETAMLLQVSRSHWSLYELRLRSLPTAALQRLAELLLIVQKAGDVNSRQSLSADETKLHQAEFQKMLSENNFQQQKLSRKIAELEKKHKGRLKVLHIVNHIEAKGESKTPHETHGLNILKSKATLASGKKDWPKLRQHQIKLKALQHEERLLREEIGEK